MIFQTISVAVLTIGVWGQPGWKIQSWTGKSKAEILNEKISKSLLVIGFLLTTITYHLIPN